jgi:hypothetical protein
MATATAIAKRQERQRLELVATLERIEAKLDQLLEQGAAKPAPAKRAPRQKKDGNT